MCVDMSLKNEILKRKEDNSIHKFGDWILDGERMANGSPLTLNVICSLVTVKIHLKLIILSNAFIYVCVCEIY